MKQTIRIPVSDQTAAEAKVGQGVRVVVTGTVKGILASRKYDTCSPCSDDSKETVYPAEVELEVDMAALTKANRQMEMLMMDDEGD